MVVVREGKDMNTTYSLQPKPAKELSSDISKAWNEIKGNVNLEALFEGKDPFESLSAEWTDKDSEAVDTIPAKKRRGGEKAKDEEEIPF